MWKLNLRYFLYVNLRYKNNNIQYIIKDVDERYEKWHFRLGDGTTSVGHQSPKESCVDALDIHLGYMRSSH